MRLPLVRFPFCGQHAIGGRAFRENNFSFPRFCFCVVCPPAKCCFDFERRLGQEQKREYACFSYLNEKKRKAVFAMKTQTHKTVSVRLCEAVYRALQEQAGKEYTTMSGVLRRLINGYLQEVQNNG